jgi:hypothetical protein
VPPIKRDSQGTELKVGQKVAYNLSGDVVPGEIVRVAPVTTYITCTSHKSWYCGRTSKVMNPRSILVVEDV